MPVKIQIHIVEYLRRNSSDPNYTSLVLPKETPQNPVVTSHKYPDIPWLLPEQVRGILSKSKDHAFHSKLH